MACTPGVKFIRLSLIFTPAPSAIKVAVPTLAPFASFKSTFCDAAHAVRTLTLRVSITFRMIFMTYLAYRVPTGKGDCAASI